MAIAAWVEQVLNYHDAGQADRQKRVRYRIRQGMKQGQRRILLAGAAVGFFCVALGAFGAHALGDMLNERARFQFDLGIRYAFYHGLALLGAGLALPVAARPRQLSLGAVFFTAGTVLFSGSLLLLAVTRLKLFAMLTPLGGLCLLAGWALFVYSMWAGRASGEAQ